MSIKGVETRARILREALSQVSKVGFEGLTLGPLADQLGLSKSGLFAHFGSREELQLAVLGLAAEDFRREILESVVYDTPRGLRRLLAILKRWFNRYPQEGCVFLAGSAEYDDRPGVMRDALADFHSQWRGSLATALRQCQEVGDLDTSMDTEQIAFELFAIAAGGHHDYRLYGREAGRRVKVAVERVLLSCGASSEKLIWK
jgi:AcrR family transcriptional regulator